MVEGLGNPLRFILSSGNRNDICLAKTLLEPFDLRGKLILADKGYDSDKFVRWIEKRGGIVVIPSRVIAKHPRNIDRLIYNERHLVENLFLKLKNRVWTCGPLSAALAEFLITRKMEHGFSHEILDNSKQFTDNKATHENFLWLLWCHLRTYQEFEG